MVSEFSNFAKIPESNPQMSNLNQRLMIVSPTFAHGYYPWTWDHDQWPSLIQWGIVFGSFGWFTLLFMLFCKIFPSVSMYEVKEMVYHRSLHSKKGETTEQGAH
jgi:molybdopterin-containing oxidoreductase family membrane subunit